MDQPALAFQVLGPLEVVAGDRLLPLGPPQQRMVLASLVLRAGEVVSVDALVDAVWGPRPPESAGNLVQGYVARLRVLLEPSRQRGQSPTVLLTRPPGYVLAVSPDQVDARRFERMVEAARRSWPARPETVATGLREALGLWRGEVLADLGDLDVARGERLRLEELRRTALDERIDADLARGRHAELVGELEALVAEDRLRERTWGQLMVALYRAGRQADALATYEAARRVLAEELGLDPGPQLQALEQAVLRQDPALQPPRPSPRAVRDNLPAALTSFVGREHELAEVTRLLDKSRLVTLTGVGGSGKTRLALEAAATVAGDFADGVWMVDLIPVADSTLVAAALATALDVREEPSRPWIDSLCEYLRPAETLIVLDNCEHVIDGCAALAGALVRACPGVRVLATSREALAIDGEIAWPVPPMAEPDAVRLFTDRSTARFAPNSGTDPAVTQICRRLDGIPLAIELAAARTRSLSAHEIAVRLDRRFRLLGQPSRGVATRHRTLRAMVDWSYELLSEQERVLFARLSVFAGGFGLAAAEAVGDLGESSVDLLARLVDKSLVLRDGDVFGLARYRLLETLREYGQERLDERGEVDLTRRRHAAYYARWVEQAAPVIFGPAGDPSIGWGDRIYEERANLLAAVTWAFDTGEPAFGVTIIHASWLLGLLRGTTSEGRALAETALRLSGDRPVRIRMVLLYAAGAFALGQGDFERAAAAGREFLSLARDHSDEAHAVGALALLGLAAWAQGDYERGRALTEQSVAAARRAGDRWHTAMGLTHLGRLAIDQGEVEDATALLDEAIAAARELGEPMALGFALERRAALAYQRGDESLADDLGGQALAHSRTAGHQEGIAAALRTVALVAARRGDDDRAAGIHQERLDVCRRLGLRGAVATCLEDLARIAAARDRPAKAARLLGAADALRTAIGAPVPGSERDDHRRLLSALREHLGEDAFTAEWAAGQRTTAPR
ncbi:MAG: BTAD domain-containing putative transcriptional regulator [Egibacteraceae bacterium]